MQSMMLHETTLCAKGSSNGSLGRRNKKILEQDDAWKVEGTLSGVLAVPVG
jgi:hypothetical protein